MQPRPWKGRCRQSALRTGLAGTRARPRQPAGSTAAGHRRLETVKGLKIQSWVVILMAQALKVISVPEVVCTGKAAKL